MKYLVCVVYDRKAAIYSNVWLSVNKKTAEREFLSTIGKTPYAGDMELYVSGEFSPETGQLLAYEKPEFLVSFDAVEE